MADEGIGVLKVRSTTHGRNYGSGRKIIETYSMYDRKKGQRLRLKQFHSSLYYADNVDKFPGSDDSKFLVDVDTGTPVTGLVYHFEDYDFAPNALENITYEVFAQALVGSQVTAIQTRKFVPEFAEDEPTGITETITFTLFYTDESKTSGVALGRSVRGDFLYYGFTNE